MDPGKEKFPNYTTHITSISRHIASKSRLWHNPSHSPKLFFFLHVGSELEEKMDFLLPKIFFSRYNVAGNRKCTEWPQTELEHLTVNITLCILNAYPWGPNVGPFRSTTSRFRDTRSSKIGNTQNDPHTEPEHLAVKTTLYTLNTYPGGPNFGPLRSTTSHFWDIRSSKIGNALDDPKLNLNTSQSKALCIHYILTPRSPNLAQILVRFALRLALTEIQGCQKLKMHRMIPNWTSTRNSQNYSVYTEYLPHRPKIWSVSLYD